jgi:MFS family permease
MDQPTKLFNRNFTTLWTGQFISKLGTQAFQIALLFMVKSLTGSASVMGAFGLIAGIPAILLGPVGGAFADRYSRRKIIVFSDLIRGLLILLLAFIVFRTPEATALILGMLLLVAVVSSIISSFFGPAISAVIPDLVPRERVAGANSLGQLSTQISAVLGLTVGGIVYSALGGLVLLVFDAFSFLFAAGAESTVRFPPTVPRKEGTVREQLESFWEEILEGLRYVWARSGLRNFVLLSTILSFFAAPVAILLTFYVQDVMQVSPAWYGFLLAFYGGGSMLGFILAGALQLPARLRGRVTILAILLQAIIYGLLGVAPNIWVAMVLMVLNGMMSGFVQVHITTIMQVSTPGEIRGRVFGLLAAIGGALTPIALGISGVIVDMLDQNIRLIFVASGIIMFVISLAVLLGRDTQELLAYEYSQEPDGVELDAEEQPLTPSSEQTTNEEIE